jgi:hypothetical protein
VVVVKDELSFAVLAFMVLFSVVGKAILFYLVAVAVRT